MPVLMQMQMRSVLCSFSGLTQYISYMHNSLLHSSSMKHTWLVICKPIAVCQILVIVVCICVYDVISMPYQYYYHRTSFPTRHVYQYIWCVQVSWGVLFYLWTRVSAVIVQLSGLMNHSETA